MTTATFSEFLTLPPPFVRIFCTVCPQILGFFDTLPSPLCADVIYVSPQDQYSKIYIATDYIFQSMRFPPIQVSVPNLDIKHIHLLGAISDRLAKNACYERDRTAIWLYFDMSEITVEEEYREGRLNSTKH